MTATGTSRSQLYHYFVNKDALISEVIKTQLGRVIAAQEPCSPRPLELALNMALGHIAGYRRSPTPGPPR
jgi:AcrR family transcriptional regulator